MTEKDVKILIVDDERAIRKFLQISLSTNGYQVVEAATGKDALQIMVMERPDMVILDLGLPDEDGIYVTQQIREWAQIPIIILV